MAESRELNNVMTSSHSKRKRKPGVFGHTFLSSPCMRKLENSANDVWFTRLPFIFACTCSCNFVHKCVSLFYSKLASSFCYFSSNQCEKTTEGIALIGNHLVFLLCHAVFLLELKVGISTKIDHWCIGRWSYVWMTCVFSVFVHHLCVKNKPYSELE